MKIFQICLYIFCLILISCSTGTDTKNDESYVSVRISQTDLYEFKTGAGGDEDGAFIKTQAKYFQLSAIIRNQETNWEPVYKYKPANAFKGMDYVELEIHTGSDGASPPANIELVKITIEVY